MANLGLSELITYIVQAGLWVVTPLVVNCASTWANQTSGSVVQKGGIMMLTAATVGPGASRAVPATVSASGPSAIS